MNNVVVHFMTGKLVKGTTHDFNKTRPVFHVQLPGAQSKPMEIKVKDTKAIFFVHALDGKRQAGMGHLEDGPTRAGYGRRARVEMYDGEIIVGFVQAYRREDPLFMLIPEKQDNNDRVFINPQGVKKFSWL